MEVQAVFIGISAVRLGYKAVKAYQRYKAQRASGDVTPSNAKGSARFFGLLSKGMSRTKSALQTGLDTCRHPVRTIKQALAPGRRAPEIIAASTQSSGKARAQEEAPVGAQGLVLMPAEAVSAQSDWSGYARNVLGLSMDDPLPEAALAESRLLYDPPVTKQESDAEPSRTVLPRVPAAALRAYSEQRTTSGQLLDNPA